MFGLAAFTFVSAGLAQWLPRVRLDETDFPGLRFFGGYALFLLLFFFLHVVATVPLTVSAWSIAALAAAGLARLAWTERAALLRDHRRWLHPVPVLIAIGAAAIAINGGVGYLPYTGDEFSNWLGASRHLFLAGDYGAIRDEIYYSGYTPGWRIALVYPWVLLGGIDEGASAAAPFVAAVAVAGLIYDTIHWRLRADTAFAAGRAALYAWAAVLVGLTGQNFGLVWSRTLLIEPPQIYTLAVATVLAYLLTGDAPRRILAGYAGLALAAAYLLKSAAVAFAPGLGLVVVLVAWREGGRAGRVAARIAALAAWTLGPLVLVIIAWKVAGPESATGSPGAFGAFTDQMLANAQARDWQDLAARFASAVWAYAASYKWPLSLVAALAVLIAALRGRHGALVSWAAFTLVYLCALYWYHLAVFGDVYFAHLNSIPRFVRVPLQMLHVAGFVVAIRELLAAPAARRLTALGDGKAAARLASALVVLLLAVQGVEIHRSVQDVTTRRYENVDPALAESRKAVTVLVAESAEHGWEKPTIVFVNQGGTADPIGYANYYARGAFPGAPDAIGLTVRVVDWSVDPPFDTAKKARSADAIMKRLRQAEMIWPIKIDDWTVGALRGLAAPASCFEAPTAVYFVRLPGEPPSFACRPKP